MSAKTDEAIPAPRQVRSPLDLAHAIREARTRRGLTQEQVARAAGMHRSHLSQIESGASTDRIDRIFQLLAELKLSLSLSSADLQPTEPSADTATPAAPPRAGSESPGRPGEPLQLVVFELAGEPYGVPIDTVREILDYVSPRTIASAQPWVRGVIELRDEIVPVCDLALRLGIAGREDGANIVVLETPAGRAGFVVDLVDEVVDVDPARIDTAIPASDRALRGVAKLEGRLVVVLDPTALLAGLTSRAKPS